MTKVTTTIFNLHEIPSSDVPKHLPQTVTSLCSSFLLLFILPSLINENRGRLIFTQPHLPSWGKIELKMKTTTVTVSRTQAVFFKAWSAIRANSASAVSWSPVTQLTTSQSLLQTGRSSLLALLLAGSPWLS